MFIGLIFEFLNPGAVAPGLVGAISLLVALYALAFVPINYAGCLAQRSFPLLTGVVLNAALLKDRRPAKGHGGQFGSWNGRYVNQEWRVDKS